MEAFSDGVFAIGITLLILEIHVPEVVPGETLLHTLLYHEWASFLALLIGFFTIFICWINHHYMYTMIYRSNSKLLLINGFKLLIVTLTPFATALLAKHIETDWGPSAIRSMRSMLRLWAWRWRASGVTRITWDLPKLYQPM